MPIVFRGNCSARKRMQRQHASPNRPIQIAFRIVRAARSDFGGRLVDRHVQHASRSDLLLCRRAQTCPSARQPVLEEMLQRLHFVRRLGDLMWMAEAHDGAIVDGMIEPGARQDKPVYQGRCQTDLTARGMCREHATRSTPVPIDVVRVPPVQSRRRYRASIDQMSDMTMGSRIEYRVQALSIIAAALGQAAYAGEGRWSRRRRWFFNCAFCLVHIFTSAH